MLKRKKAISIMLVFVIVLSLIAVGCSDTKSSSSNSSNQDNQSTTTLTKEDKSTLVVANMSDAATVDPHAAGDSASVNALNMITETLYEYDDNGDLVPLLAENYEQLDEVTYRFYLKQGVKFHNGVEMKASDVVYSFKRALSPIGARVQYIMNAIDPDGFEIEDDYTVIIRTKEPFSPFVSYLPYIGAAIISEQYYEEKGEAASQHPIGSGPYKFVEWKKADRIVLERNDDYWGEKPDFEKVVIRTITEANGRTIELETGGVDIAYNILANDIKRVEEHPDLELKRRLSTVFTFLAFNTQKEPFNNVKLRQAIDYAIDEEGIVEAVYRGTSVYTPGPVTPKQKYYDDSDTGAKYDVEKAKALLKEIGMDSGLTFDLWTAERQDRIDIAQIVQSQLREIGININIKVVEWGAFLDAMARGEHDLTISGWGAVGFPDPDNNLYGPFHSSNIPDNNYAFYNNPELDDLLEKSRMYPDGPKREQVVKEAQRLLRREVPIITFNNSEQIVGVRKYVKGFVPSAASSHKVNRAYFE